MGTTCKRRSRICDAKQFRKALIWLRPADSISQIAGPDAAAAAAISSDELASGLNALQKLQTIMNDPTADDLEPLIRALV